jgi:hypothetical protein
MMEILRDGIVLFLRFWMMRKKNKDVIKRSKVGCGVPLRQGSK